MMNFRVFVCIATMVLCLMPLSANAQNCVIEVGDFCTYTQGGWGTDCNGNNPGCIRDACFAGSFPGGLTIGGGFTLTLSSSAAVEAFLPAGGTADAFDQNYVDVTSTNAGVFAGQLVALTLNVAFGQAGCGGLTDISGLFIAYGPYQGLTVAQLLALANAVIGGDLSGLPVGGTISNLSDAVAGINENFDNCTVNEGYLETEPGCDPGQDCPLYPAQYIVLGEHLCLHFCGRPLDFYWCCPLDGAPVFTWERGCNFGAPGCETDCSPMMGNLTWTYEGTDDHSECPAPGAIWRATFTATDTGCVCVWLERQLSAELLDFALVAGDAEVALDWSTASESDNDHFEISRDGHIIANIPGAGISSSRRDYHWIDESVQNGRTYSYTLTSVDVNGARDLMATQNGTPREGGAVIADYALDQNFPNPFNPSTEITYSLATAGDVNVSVFNVLGVRLATLVSGYQDAGSHAVTFDAAALPSGVYVYKLSTDGFSATRKMLLMK